MQKKNNLNDSYCEHLTAFPGGMQKKMNLKNRHCEEAKGRRGNLLPHALRRILHFLERFSKADTTSRIQPNEIPALRLQ
jgi:hypothetical protein